MSHSLSDKHSRRSRSVIEGWAKASMNGGMLTSWEQRQLAEDYIKALDELDAARSHEATPAPSFAADRIAGRYRWPETNAVPQTGGTYQPGQESASEGSSEGAAPSATVTPEQFNDVLKRIVSRMNGHTVSHADLPAFRSFMGLLNRTTPYSCGIGPMPREGNSATSDGRADG